MRDAVTSLIRNYDISGRYLDRDAIDNLKAYFNSGMARIKAAQIINANAANIVKSASSKLFEEIPELILILLVVIRLVCEIWIIISVMLVMLW